MPQPEPAVWINGRQIFWLKNEHLQLAVASGGGHIAAIAPAASDPVHDNPLWVPPWPSHEPSAVSDSQIANEYGGAPEGRTLASILGHNLCLDLFGAPSAEESAAGVPTHGFFGVLAWHWSLEADVLVGRCSEPAAQLCLERRIRLDSRLAWIEERVENRSCWDHQLCWQQHVTLGPLWLEDEAFWLEANCDLGHTLAENSHPDSRLLADSAAQWPHAPGRDGRVDYRRPIATPRASDFATFRVRPLSEWGYFLAGNARRRLALFYIWPRKFFPWLGIWDEKFARLTPPWNGRTYTRGLEFGASPRPQSRRATLAQPRLLETPTYLTLPARGELRVGYACGMLPCAGAPVPRLRVQPAPAGSAQSELWAEDQLLGRMPQA